ncbi:binding-protein-dependent transport systems inner membrane component [Caldicellulosiruptor kronotskyensis 2002]|uniref:Binding-protein-dependent transport systems inner membrane component n=1 Tax=Caldicellulosiruptor kronotskyensis (strain DSM 18902 / VKM B-2412 / 2002) TaxID=632348 RepID=E4SHI6_CALK2|nr:carbohydrate ABC transporter permease [Caldicellulosiruptor kronotskyensis]ADQ47211.1 binding-protein-dependent transport systems inner membrane component [Caldicellulosiruptor kronotskyensis 2002]
MKVARAIKINYTFEKFRITDVSKLVFKKNLFIVLKKLFLYTFIICMSYILLYPILFLISNALRAKEDLFDPSVIWIPKHITFKNFEYANMLLSYPLAIKNTLIILIPSVIIQTFICMMVGYGFARFRFAERELLFGILLFTIIVPMQTIIVPLYMKFRYFDFLYIGKLIGIFTGKPMTINLLDTPWPFYILNFFGMGIRSSLYIFVFRQFFRNMPVELEEAAKIDGCGPFSTFLRIMVPNATGAIITILLFTIVWHWNDYYVSAMFCNENLPVSVMLTALNNRMSMIQDAYGFSSDDIYLIGSNVLEAGCLMVILPLIIVYIIGQRYFTESIERTGIVG